MMYSSHFMNQSIVGIVFVSFKWMSIVPQGKMCVCIANACISEDFTLRSLYFEWFSSAKVNFRLQNDAHTLPFSRAWVLHKMVAYELQRTSLERSTWRKPPNFRKSRSGIHTNLLDYHPNQTSSGEFSSDLPTTEDFKHLQMVLTHFMDLCEHIPSPTNHVLGLLGAKTNFGFGFH